MKHLTEYIIERGPAPRIDRSETDLILLDTTREDEHVEQSVAEFDEKIERINKEYDAFVISGEIGRWNEKKGIYPEYFTDLMEAYQKCIEKMDDIIVKFMEGALEVTGIHHDGENTLYIKPLSKEGSEVMHDFFEGYENEYFEDLTDDRFYKKFFMDKNMIKEFDVNDFS